MRGTNCGASVHCCCDLKDDETQLSADVEISKEIKDNRERTGVKCSTSVCRRGDLDEDKIRRGGDKDRTQHERLSI